MAEKVSKMKLLEGGKTEKINMGNQLSYSCWLLPCATTFESARFLSKINDLPVFSYRISLHRVYTVAQFDSNRALKDIAEFIVRGKTAKGM